MSSNDCRYLATSISIVIDDIAKYVIPENIRAIEYLWSLNIITTMTNNYDDNHSWISIGKLSDENQLILNKILDERRDKIREGLIDPNDLSEPYVGFTQGGGIGFNLPIVPGTKDTFDEFKKLIDVFSFQDVQDDGYITEEQFIVLKTDCWRKVVNPHYEFGLHSDALNLKSIEDEYDDKTKEMIDKNGKENTGLFFVRIPDYKKMGDLSVNDLIDRMGYSHLYDPEEGRIYLHQMLYDGHMKYKAINNANSGTKAKK